MVTITHLEQFVAVEGNVPDEPRESSPCEAVPVMVQQDEELAPAERDAEALLLEVVPLGCSVE